MTSIIIVDVRGVITKSGQDVLLRHAEYGAALQRLKSDATLYVLSRDNVYNHFSSAELKIISAKSIFVLFKKGMQLLKSVEGPTLLVSGDPWESFFASLLLRRISKKHAPIQVQLHADIGSENWRTVNVRNRIRYFFTTHSLRRADQIRCVSNSQLLNLAKVSPFAESKAVVIPVPIKVNPNWVQDRKIDSNCCIAIVGRIHKDRGIREFVRVCVILINRFPSLKILVIGEGPHKNWLNNLLKKEGLHNSSYFLGNKSQQELSSLWKTFGCVVSLAPSEAFGRTARESLTYGVPVIARDSSGISSLKDSYQGRGIWIIDTLSDDELVDLFKLLLDWIVPIEVGEALIKEANSLSKKLAESWLKASK